MMGEIVPTMNVGGNSGNGGWGDAVGAFAGALVGSWFTNGWGGGYGGGRGGYGGGPVIVNGGGHGSDCCSSAELDALSGIQSSVNAVGLNVIQGQNASNLAACQGFSGVTASGAANTAQLQNSMNQGFGGLNTVIQGGNFGLQQTLCQGFNGVERAISDCCCSTKQTIMAEGQATRDLISKYAYEELQNRLCDAKSKISSLETQNFVSASQAAQTAQFQHAIDRQSIQFGTILQAYRTGRIDERDSTATTTPAA